MFFSYWQTQTGVFLRKRFVNKRKITYWQNGFTNKGLAIPLAHRGAYFTAVMPRVEAFVWKKYSYRHFNEDFVKAFKEWIVLHNWSKVYAASGSNNIANDYQTTINSAIERFFPLKTTRRRSTDLLWLTKLMKKMISNRKSYFCPRRGLARRSNGRRRKELMRGSWKERPQRGSLPQAQLDVRSHGHSTKGQPLYIYIQVLFITRKLTRLRRRIGLQVKLFLLNLYVVGSLPCILKSNWIGLQVKLGRGEREREMNSWLGENRRK